MFKLDLVQDGRDIDRIVDVTGCELHLAAVLGGRIVAYQPTRGGALLDSFTRADWDDILSAGQERTLDQAAGTIYTIVNW